MKYSIILIVVGILQVSATGYAQNLKVSIDITNGTIYDVVTEIEKQTGMTFFYKDSDISPQHAVTVKVRNKTVPEVLDRTIKGTDLAYGFNNRCIILTKKEFLATALVSQQQQQQGKRITGKVIDGVTGEPIIGANVVEKGTTNGTSSDSEGGFYITVRENATLQVSYLGYKAVEVSVLAAISGQTFEIKLFEDTQALEEVVVVGYGVQQKRDLTGSIVNVKGEKIKNIPVVSAANALQGRVTGVDFVTSDGRPGEQPNIRIRGTGTINGAEPLVVIDGIPAGSISDIAPNDIESIEVLKDASSGAIYGTRAANGVIIITTKRGKKNDRLKTEVNVSNTATSIYRKLDLLTAPDLVMLKKERYTMDGIEVLDFWNDPYYAVQRTDWQDAYFGTGNVFNGDVRITGGSEQSNYMTSLSYYDERGTVYNTGYSRISFRANSDHQLTKRLKFSESFQFNAAQSLYDVYISAQSGPVWSLLRFNPAIPVKNDDGTWGSSQSNTELGDINNPVFEAHENKANGKNYSVLGTVNLVYNILDGLYLNLSGSFNGTQSKSQTFSPIKLYQARTATNNALNKSESESYTYITEGYLSYLKTLNEVHKINATAGVSYQYSDGEYWSVAKSGLSDESDEQITLDNASTMNGIGGGYNDMVKLSSAYGRLFYSFMDKYLVTLTYRADASSRFAPGKRIGYFPALSLGWRLTNEDFFPKSDVLNDLKLVAGWGKLGNQNVGAFQYLAVMQRGGSWSSVLFGTEIAQGAIISMLPNPNITWEKTATTNIGLEGRLLDNQLTASVAWYNRKTTDMLIPAVVVGTQGSTGVPASNIGEMSNRGWEFEIGWNKTVNKDFSYYFAANAAYNKNNVDKLYGNDNYIGTSTYGRQAQEISRTYEGYPIASFYGWKTDGLYQNQSEIDNDPNIRNDERKSGIKPGDVRFVDQNGDGLIDEKDRTYLGHPNPLWTAGFQMGAYYKGFDISTNFYGNFGVTLFNADRMTGLDPAMSYNMYAEALGRWHGEGTSNTIPRMSVSKFNQNHRTSDLFIENGNFLKFKNLTIGYTLPQAISKAIYLNSLRFFFVGEDFLILTKYSGFSPELGYNNGNVQKGVDMAKHPVLKRFALGLTLNF